jgi:hypothetical protein
VPPSSKVSAASKTHSKSRFDVRSVVLVAVRNYDKLLTGNDMEVLASRVMEYVNELPEGTPVAAKELLHLGRRAAVD